MRGGGIKRVVKCAYLYFGQDGDNGYDDAENEVQADEGLVFSAVIRLDVKQVEQHHSSKRQGVEQNGEEEEACDREGVTLFISKFQRELASLQSGTHL